MSPQNPRKHPPPKNNLLKLNTEVMMVKMMARLVRDKLARPKKNVFAEKNPRLPLQLRYQRLLRKHSRDLRLLHRRLSRSYRRSKRG